MVPHKMIVALLAAGVALSGCSHVAGTGERQADTHGAGAAGDAMEKQDGGQAVADEPAYQYAGDLEDVSGGTATGRAQARFSDGRYDMLATFDGLPEPEGTDFYEGWIVRKSPFKFLSTGRVDRVGGVYTDTFTSGEDLTDFSRYVLTLEPDDGDPAPAAHIVEGDMLRL